MATTSTERWRRRWAQIQRHSVRNWQSRTFSPFWNVWKCYSATAGLAYVLRQFCSRRLIFWEAVPCFHGTLLEIHKEKDQIANVPSTLRLSLLLWLLLSSWNPPEGHQMAWRQLRSNVFSVILRCFDVSKTISLKSHHKKNYKQSKFWCCTAWEGEVCAFPAPRTKPWNPLEAISNIKFPAEVSFKSIYQRSVEAVPLSPGLGFTSLRYAYRPSVFHM